MAFSRSITVGGPTEVVRFEYERAEDAEYRELDTVAMGVQTIQEESDEQRGTSNDNLPEDLGDIKNPFLPPGQRTRSGQPTERDNGGRTEAHCSTNIEPNSDTGTEP